MSEKAPVQTNGNGSNLSKYVGGEKLLVTLWEEDCRPTLRWLREQTRAKKIPHVKRGRLYFYDPVKVKASLG